MADEKGWYGKVNEAQEQFNDRVKQSWIGKVAGWVNEKIMPAMYAWTRQGAKEAAQALQAFPDSIRPVEELGTMGNPTQMSVNHEQGNVWGKPEAARDAGFDAWINEKAQQAAKQSPERGMEAERGVER
jgi:hypothetical protein